MQHCLRCGGSLVEEPASKEVVCVACGDRPPDAWTLGGLSDSGLQSLIKELLDDVVNDLRYSRPEGERFFTSPMFMVLVRYFKTTPRQLEEAIRSEIHK